MLMTINSRLRWWLCLMVQLKYQQRRRYNWVWLNFQERCPSTQDSFDSPGFESFFAMQEGVHAPARSWDIARSASMRPHRTPQIYAAKARRKSMFFWISSSLLLYMGSGGKWFRVLVAEWNRLLVCFFAGIWNWGQPPFKPHHSLLIHKLHFVILHLLLRFCISKLGCWTLFCSKEYFRDVDACQIA